MAALFRTVGTPLTAQCTSPNTCPLSIGSRATGICMCFRTTSCAAPYCMQYGTYGQALPRPAQSRCGFPFTLALCSVRHVRHVPFLGPTAARAAGP